MAGSLLLDLSLLPGASQHVADHDDIKLLTQVGTGRVWEHKPPGEICEAGGWVGGCHTGAGGWRGRKRLSCSS